MNRLRTIFSSILLLTLLVGCVPIAPPRPPIEPAAGQWGTWVLSSSAELRPAAPPDATATAEERAQLQALMTTNDEATIAQVLYWDAGAPTYRWVELALERYGRGPPNPRVSRGLALLNVAIYDAIVATWEAKYTYNRPRPTGVTPLIEMPASPSIPPNMPPRRARRPLCWPISSPRKQTFSQPKQMLRASRDCMPVCTIRVMWMPVWR